MRVHFRALASDPLVLFVARPSIGERKERIHTWLSVGGCKDTLARVNRPPQRAEGAEGGKQKVGEG